MSKLHGHRYNGVNAPSVLREELTFDGAQDKECSRSKGEAKKRETQSGFQEGEEDVHEGRDLGE